jgi:hypothetical protein
MKNVTTRDTGRDITQLLQIAADRHGFDPIGFIGGAIGESSLKEQARREMAWPDVSYGLWQPAVAFLGADVRGLTRNANGTVQDTQQNRDTAQAFCFDAAKLIDYVAPRYARLLQDFGTPLEAWCRWNAPAIAGDRNPHQPAIRRALADAEQFRDQPETGATVAEPDIVFIGAHPTNFSVGRGGIKPEAVVLHIAEGPMSAVDSFFNQVHSDPPGPTSAHFCVGKDGTLHQYVNTQNTAFGNGRIEPDFTARLINDNSGINPNRWTVSIEHEGHSGDAVTEAQLRVSTQLTAWLFQNRLLNSGATDVAVDRDHILRHADISPRSRQGCPGFSDELLDRYIAEVRALLGMS